VPAVLTSNAVLICPHGGKVVIVPKQIKVGIDGGFVICEPDLIGAPIVNCKIPVTPLTSPCLLVVSTLPGSSSPTVLVGGRQVYVQTLVGITNGRPPGTVTVVSPGQVKVQAP